MPKRTDIKKILVIGSGPIVIGQAAEFDYAGTQACLALREESLKDTGLTLTHINILDNTIEGVECVKDRVFSVQYHPESAPGPVDSSYLFDYFIDLMED